MKLILILIIFSAIILPNSSILAEEDIDLNISVIGEETQYHDENQILVAGIWNNIDIDMGSQKPRNLKLILHKGDSLPTIKNSSNYYEWTYTENDAEPWKSQINYENYTYIDTSNCDKYKAVYSFKIGIKDILPKEIFSREKWTIKLYSNNQLVYSNNFWLEKATRGLAHSHGDVIYFYADPFTEMTASGNNFFTLKNTGNIPLEIKAEYPNFVDFIEFDSFTEHLSPKKDYNYELTLHSGSWQPQRIVRTGTVSAKVLDKYIVDDTDSMVYLKTAFKLDLPSLNVFVGHSGYELIEDILDTGLSFQYKKNVEMYEGEIIDLNAYISGDGTINLDIWTNDSRNIRILKIIKNGKEISSPFDITSTSTEEQKIVVRVEAIREGKSGDIHYDFKTNTGKTKSFQTHITISEPYEEIEETSKKSKASFGSNNIITGVVVISIISVIIYMFISQIRHKRR